MSIDLPINADSLTDREREILRLLSTGMSDSEIAEITVLTVGTVKWYNRQIYAKLGARNRTEAVDQARQMGLLAGSATAASAPKHNLPAHVTSFVGRVHELDTLKGLIGSTRLVTLTGPPGTGKTRLALAVAREMLPAFRHGVYFVPLAPIRESRLVVNTIAQTLDVQESRGETLIQAVIKRLEDQHLLLVLDNFEHLLDAAPLVSDLLAAAPRLTVLVTSREILNLYGEHEFSVPPLNLPHLIEPPSAASLQSYEAVQLFVDRARAASPAFELDSKNTDAVASICVHLDGLPLAIELAAVHIRFYAPETLLMRLGSRLEALSDGPRDLPARQRTLRSTLAWSYDLLDPDEQVLFARLGVFTGGFTLEDAAAVCSDGLQIDMTQGVKSLLGKSLLQREPTTLPTSRFMMLETMREYALGKLDEQGELAEIRKRHADYFLSIANQSKQEIRGAKRWYWLAWAEMQHDNLRSALQWSLTFDPTGQMSLSFIGRLAFFWKTRGLFSEGRAWFSEANRLPGAAARTRARADALDGIAGMTYLQCDYATTRTLAEEALVIYEALGDDRNTAQTLIKLGEVATEIGDYTTAPALFHQAYAILRPLGNVLDNAEALSQLGYGALRSGDLDQARRWLEEGRALYQEGDDDVGAAGAYCGLGEIAIRTGDLQNAESLLQTSLTLRQRLGTTWGIAVSLASLAWVALLRGETDRAVQLLIESLLIRMDIDDKGGMAWCLEKFAEIAHLKGDDRQAARLYGGATKLRASVNSVVDPVDQPAFEARLEAIRANLTPEVFEALLAEGQSIPPMELLHYGYRGDA